jgi:hypothetical protein
MPLSTRLLFHQLYTSLQFRSHPLSINVSAQRAAFVTNRKYIALNNRLSPSSVIRARFCEHDNFRLKLASLRHRCHFVYKKHQHACMLWAHEDYYFFCLHHLISLLPQANESLPPNLQVSNFRMSHVTTPSSSGCSTFPPPEGKSDLQQPLARSDLDSVTLGASLDYCS